MVSLMLLPAEDGAGPAQHSVCPSDSQIVAVCCAFSLHGLFALLTGIGLLLADDGAGSSSVF